MNATFHLGIAQRFEASADESPLAFGQVVYGHRVSAWLWLGS